MKRYAVFAFDTYYPGGGWSDFVTSHDSVAAATAAATASGRDHWEIIDLQSGETVAES